LDISWIVTAVLLLALGACAIALYRKSCALTEERVAASALSAQVPDLESLRSAMDRSTQEIIRLTEAKSVLEGLCKRLPELEAENKSLIEQLVTANTEVARVRAETSEREKAFQTHIQSLESLRSDVQERFKNLAADSLADSQQTFLRLANETFSRHREGVATEVAAKQEAVDGLVQPLVKMLTDYQDKISQIELLQHKAYGELSAELKQVADTQNSVRVETAKLVNALRAAPKTRGRWGEHTLRNVIELAGLSSHCDFAVERTFSDETGSLRPDLIINLPGSRSLVVDAKTSLQSYLDAVEATDDSERERLLQLHASQLRNHSKQLGSKAYWEKLTATPDFVVMFVPGTISIRRRQKKIRLCLRTPPRCAF
jgi:DNA recombination protein RmuC